MAPIEKYPKNFLLFLQFSRIIKKSRSIYAKHGIHLQVLTGGFFRSLQSNEQDMHDRKSTVESELPIEKFNWRSPLLANFTSERSEFCLDDGSKINELGVLFSSEVRPEKKYGLNIV